jgi:hypothetical protein
VTDSNDNTDQASNRPRKILVISPTATHPQNSGSRVRIYRLLRNLKELGHEVHFFLLDKEYRSNHVDKRADLQGMHAAWDGFTYLQDRPRLAFAGLIDRLGLGRVRRALLPRRASREKGRFWKIRNWLGGNSWRIQKLKHDGSSILRSIIDLIDQILRIPRLVRRAIGALLKTALPSVYNRLKPHFPDNKGMPLDRLMRSGDDRISERSGVSEIDAWYNFDINSMLQELHAQEKFDAVIVEYVYLSQALTNFGSDVQKIIDTHDVFTDRNRQYEDLGLVETFFTTTKEEEAKGLARADAIIAIQDQEREVLQTLTSKPVFTVGHTVHLARPVPVTEVRKAVLFLGAANAANIHSVEWFQQDVMPLIQAEVEDVQFYVAGQVCAFVADQKNVIKLGELDDVSAVYAHADVVINPAAVGSGLKIKCIEALGLGKVLISSPHAGAGLGDRSRKPFIEADGSREFATAIINLFNSADLFNDLALRAYRFARKYNQTTLSALRHMLSDEVALPQSAHPVSPVQGQALRKQATATPNFMIIASARTGSTTLADLLNVHPAVSCLLEPFNREHGVLWGKSNYVQKLENGALLIDVVRSIFSEHQGFKHLLEQLTPAENELLIRFPEAKRIFLWRRNHLQRVVSNHISMSARHWNNDTNKIMVAKFEPVDIDALSKKLEKQKRHSDRYRQLCVEAGCYELAYEDMFGAECSASEKLRTLDQIFDYLEIARIDRLSDEAAETIKQLLNPQNRKLNSSATYRLIPNIAEIEAQLGSTDNGYLFP